MIIPHMGKNEVENEYKYVTVCQLVCKRDGSLNSLNVSKGFSKIFFYKHCGFKAHFLPSKDAVLDFRDQNDSLGRLYTMRIFPFQL